MSLFAYVHVNAVPQKPEEDIGLLELQAMCLMWVLGPELRPFASVASSPAPWKHILT